MGKLMKGLVAGLMVVGLLAMAAPGSWAQNVDPLTIGTTSPGALEGDYQTGGGLLQFLAVASPTLCNDGSDATDCPLSGHLWFYNAACSRISDKAVPLTENDLEIVPLHDPLVTQNRVGNVLVAATLPNAQFGQVRLATNPIIGQTWFVDTVRGIARIQDLARLSNNNGNGWAPYKPAHVLILAPPDDGSFLTGTLIFRCPVGTALLAKANGAGGFIVGTPGTLGGDMLDLANQDEGGLPNESNDPLLTTATSSTICDDCTTNGVFAKALQAFVFDDDELLLQSVDNIQCRCLGAAFPAGGTFVNEIRLKDLSVHAGVRATYWEIFSFGFTPAPENQEVDALFTAALNVVANFGPAGRMNFYSRLWNANARTNIEP
jgi:hypothetical protein